MDKKIAIHTMELWLANLPVTPGHVQHGHPSRRYRVQRRGKQLQPHRHGRTADEQPQGSNSADARLPARLWPCGPPASPSASRSWRWTSRASFAVWGEVSDWYDRLAIQHALAEQLGIELQVNLAA